MSSVSGDPVGDLECLVANDVSAVVLCNYISAIKAQCVLYDLQYNICNSVKIKYFIKSVKISRPLCLKPHDVMDLTASCNSEI